MVQAVISLTILKQPVSRNLPVFVCDVTIPRDRLVVITGVPGPGKPALAVRPALYAEGQRQYVESLFPCARRFPGLISAACVWGGAGLSKMGGPGAG
jgi:excinuclease UvrABC ATPase subunit